MSRDYDKEIKKASDKVDELTNTLANIRHQLQNALQVKLALEDLKRLNEAEHVKQSVGEVISN